MASIVEFHRKHCGITSELACHQIQSPSRKLRYQERSDLATKVRALGAVAQVRKKNISIVCPFAAQKLLHKHDGRSCRLEKPDVDDSGLLARALTNVSGQEWQRQRKAFQAAVSCDEAGQRCRHGHAAESAASFALELIGTGIVGDVRHLAQCVAARGIVRVVLGSSAPVEVEAQLLDFERNRFKRGGFAEILAASVQSRAKSLRDCSPLAHDGVPPCGTSGTSPKDAFHDAGTGLLPRLLGQEGLSHEEAVDNAHGCLLAGFETTSTLLQCALLRLAARPDLQREVRQELDRGNGGYSGSVRTEDDAHEAVPKSIAAILQETLRVHPPVAGLPRVVIDPDGVKLAGLVTKNVENKAGEAVDGDSNSYCLDESALVNDSTKLEGDKHTFLPNGCAIKIDLVGLAHGRNSNDAVGLEDDTWNWEPFAPPESGGRRDGAAPWGLGPRKCPAGNISLLLVGEVLKVLLTRFDWCLDTARDKAWFREIFPCSERVALIFEDLGEV